MSGLESVKWNPNQRVDHANLNDTGYLKLRDYEKIMASVIGDGTNIVLTGLSVAPVSGMTVRVPVGALLKGAGRGELVLNEASIDLTLDPSDVSLARVDSVEVDFDELQAALQSVDVINPSTGAVSADSKYTRIWAGMKAQVHKGTNGVPAAPVITAATAAALTGSVDISSPIDLSLAYNLKLSVDGAAAVVVDCRGATPAATTIAEIKAAINAAGFGAIATGTTYVTLTSTTAGPASAIRLTPPGSSDGLAAILGLAVTANYDYQYAGTGKWAKLAEVAVGAGVTTINAGNISGVVSSSSWTTDAGDTKLAKRYQEHRVASPIDHPAGSILESHLHQSVRDQLLGQGALTALQTRLTSYGNEILADRVDIDYLMNRPAGDSSLIVEKFTDLAGTDPTIESSSGILAWVKPGVYKSSDGQVWRKGILANAERKRRGETVDAYDLRAFGTPRVICWDETNGCWWMANTGTIYKLLPDPDSEGKMIAVGSMTVASVTSIVGIATDGVKVWVLHDGAIPNSLTGHLISTWTGAGGAWTISGSVSVTGGVGLTFGGLNGTDKILRVAIDNSTTIKGYQDIANVITANGALDIPLSQMGNGTATGYWNGTQKPRAIHWDGAPTDAYTTGNLWITTIGGTDYQGYPVFKFTVAGVCTDSIMAVNRYAYGLTMKDGDLYVLVYSATAPVIATLYRHALKSSVMSEGHIRGVHDVSATLADHWGMCWDSITDGGCYWACDATLKIYKISADFSTCTAYLQTSGTAVYANLLDICFENDGGTATFYIGAYKSTSASAIIKMTAAEIAALTNVETKVLKALGATANPRGITLMGSRLFIWAEGANSDGDGTALRIEEYSKAGVYQSKSCSVNFMGATSGCFGLENDGESLWILDATSKTILKLNWDASAHDGVALVEKAIMWPASIATARGMVLRETEGSGKWSLYLAETTYDKVWRLEPCEGNADSESMQRVLTKYSWPVATGGAAGGDIYPLQVAYGERQHAPTEFSKQANVLPDRYAVVLSGSTTSGGGNASINVIDVTDEADPKVFMRFEFALDNVFYKNAANNLGASSEMKVYNDCVYLPYGSGAYYILKIDFVSDSAFLWWGGNAWYVWNNGLAARNGAGGWTTVVGAPYSVADNTVSIDVKDIDGERYVVLGTYQRCQIIREKAKSIVEYVYASNWFQTVRITGNDKLYMLLQNPGTSSSLRYMGSIAKILVSNATISWNSQTGEYQEWTNATVPGLICATAFTMDIQTVYEGGRFLTNLAFVSTGDAGTVYQKNLIIIDETGAIFQKSGVLTYVFIIAAGTGLVGYCVKVVDDLVFVSLGNGSNAGSLLVLKKKDASFGSAHVATSDGWTVMSELSDTRRSWAVPGASGAGYVPISYANFSVGDRKIFAADGVSQAAYAFKLPYANASEWEGVGFSFDNAIKRCIVRSSAKNDSAGRKIHAADVADAAWGWGAGWTLSSSASAGFYNGKRRSDTTSGQNKATFSISAGRIGEVGVIVGFGSGFEELSFSISGTTFSASGSVDLGEGATENRRSIALATIPAYGEKIIVNLWKKLSAAGNVNVEALWWREDLDNALSIRQFVSNDADQAVQHWYEWGTSELYNYVFTMSGSTGKYQLASEPDDVLEDTDTRLTKKATPASLGAGEWAWAAGVLYARGTTGNVETNGKRYTARYSNWTAEMPFTAMQAFNGTGSQTVFTLTAPAESVGTVLVDNVELVENVDYIVEDYGNNTIAVNFSISSAPPGGTANVGVEFFRYGTKLKDRIELTQPNNGTDYDCTVPLWVEDTGIYVLFD